MGINEIITCVKTYVRGVSWVELTIARGGNFFRAAKRYY